MQSSAPHLLIAMPVVQDSDFAQTVILLLHHEEDGAVGVVLNRAFRGCHRRASRLIGMDVPARAMASVRTGGPLENEAPFLVHSGHRSLPVRETLGDGLFVSSHLEDLLPLVRSSRSPYRVFVGHAGWGAGQLEQEMAIGAWLSAPLDRRLIFEVPPESLYDAALASLGISREDLVFQVTPGAAN